MNSIFRCIAREAKLYHRITVQQQRTIKRWVAPTLREIQKRKSKMPEAPPPKRSTFLEWNYGAELYAFANRLGEKFDETLLRQAMVQADFVKHQEAEQKKVDMEVIPMQDNAKLASEGRSFASAYVVSFLRHSLPCLPEDGVRAIHDHLMSEEILANISFHIGTKDLILTADMPEPSESTLATTLCAIIGALGRTTPDRASLLVHDFLISQLTETSIADLWIPSDPWKSLEEILSRDKKAAPEARLAFEDGSGTLLAVYCIVVFSDKVMLGKGFGESVLEGKNMAALDALRRMFKTTDAMTPLLSGSPPSLDQLKSTKPNPSLNQWSQNIVQV